MVMTVTMAESMNEIDRFGDHRGNSGIAQLYSRKNHLLNTDVCTGMVGDTEKQL